MRNVTYRFTGSAAVHIKSLDGELVSVKPAEFPVFDKRDSFHLRIASAEISIAAADLASIFNSYVFARPNAPLSGLSVSIQNGRVKIKGPLHQVGVVPIMDPADPFNFYLDRYNAQLSAGYTKITPSFGLRVFMKDLNKLGKQKSKNTATN